MGKPLSKESTEAKDFSLLSDLKAFEALHEKKLEAAILKAEQDIERERAKTSLEIDKLRASYKKRFEAALEKEKQKAREQAKGIFTDFKKRESSLRGSFEKNKAKAAKAVFAELLGAK